MRTTSPCRLRSCKKVLLNCWCCESVISLLWSRKIPWACNIQPDKIHRDVHVHLEIFHYRSRWFYLITRKIHQILKTIPWNYLAMSFSGNFQCILKEENKEYGSGRSCVLSVSLSLSFGGGGWGFEFVGVALLKRPIFINIDSRNLYTSQKWSYFYINHFCVSTNLRPLLLIKKK